MSKAVVFFQKKTKLVCSAGSIVRSLSWLSDVLTTRPLRPAFDTYILRLLTYLFTYSVVAEAECCCVGEAIADENEEGEEKSESGSTKYQLIGVVVHSGQASGGHYYSYILHRSVKPLLAFLQFLFIQILLFSSLQLASEAGNSRYLVLQEDVKTSIVFTVDFVFFLHDCILIVLCFFLKLPFLSYNVCFVSDNAYLY